MAHTLRLVRKIDIIGKKDPQLPNNWPSIDEAGMTMTKGDYLASRCTVVNTRERDVSTGPTTNDEMCWFVVMYWVEGPRTLEKKACTSQGFPHYSWSSGLEGKLPVLRNIPNEEASTL